MKINWMDTTCFYFSEWEMESKIEAIKAGYTCSKVC